MTKEQLYEILGDMNEKYIKEAREIPHYNGLERNREIKSFKNEIRKINIPTTAAAVMAICIFVTGATVFATSEKMQGFFKDIYSITGAVIGSTYEQATDEMEIKISGISDKMEVEAKMLKQGSAPYNSFEAFGIENYKITDMEGKMLIKGKPSEMAEIKNGIVMISIPLKKLPSGEYKLVIMELVGASKGDQPCVLRGNWECEFSVE